MPPPAGIGVVFGCVVVGFGGGVGAGVVTEWVGAGVGVVCVDVVVTGGGVAAGGGLGLGLGLGAGAAWCFTTFRACLWTTGLAGATAGVVGGFEADGLAEEPQAATVSATASVAAGRDMRGSR
jgi:hypothetical protein